MGLRFAPMLPLRQAPGTAAADGTAVIRRSRSLAVALGSAIALAAFTAAPAAEAQTVSITSTPANGTHYVLGEAITTRLSGLAGIYGVAGGAFSNSKMAIDIGGVTRQASVTSGCCSGIAYATFSYTVQRDDLDTDGITIPANSISGPVWRAQLLGNLVDRSHSALTNQAIHEVIGSAAAISSSTPSPLTSGNLDGATLAVGLTGTTFGGSVSAADFSVSATPAITGLSVSGVSGVTSGGTTATLTLSYGGPALTSDRSFAVTMAAAAHAGGRSLTTGTVTVSALPPPPPPSPPPPRPPPVVTLSLNPAPVSENGGVSTVTATLSRALGAATTVTVTAAPQAPATAGDFDLSSTTTLTIAARATTSTGTVTVSAVDNDVDAPDKRVAISGTAVNDLAGARGMTVAGATLTIEDDDEKGLAVAGGGALGPVAVPDAGAVYARYALALTSRPLGPVTVAVSPGNEDLSTSPARLVFAPEHWNTPQTVTVGAREYAGAAASLTHRASGGGYDGVTKTVHVAGETKLVVREGSRSYGIRGYRVTVVAEAGVPDGVELDLGDLPAVSGSQERTLRLAIGPVGTAPASEGYGFGPEGARTVVDVAVTQGSVPSPGLRLCLPMHDGVGRAARGRALRLLRHDGARWTALRDSVYDAARRRVCASGVASFSPFAVGYEDARPEFGGDFPQELTFTVDEAIEAVTLPRAAGGDGALEYALSPALPAGLTREGRVVSGTPAEEFAETGYTWTATDLDGRSQRAELTFTIEVVAPVGPARTRLAAVHRSILPEVSRASWSSAMEAVTRRLGSAAGGGGSGASGEGLAGAVAGFLQANGQALEEGGVSWKELWSGRSFALALGGEGEGGGAGTGGGRSVTVWGAGDWRNLSRDVDSLDWSGELFAAHLGADAGVGSGGRAGVGLSWFESELDYTDRGGDEPVQGEHRSRMASVQPYVGWTPRAGTRLWASVGYGSGEVEVRDKALRERFGRQESDSELLGAAAGGAVRLVSQGALRLDLKGEGQATRYEVDDNGDLIEGLSVQTQRLRVAMEGSGEYELSDGARVAPSAELGVRWDGGDGATGAGVEVGGGLSWSDAGGRLTLEARGRALVAHRGELDEWGLSGGVRLAPGGSNGRGLSMSVEPVWGVRREGAARLWEQGLAGGRPAGGERTGDLGMDAELGYGLAAFGGFGVATPYLRYGQAQQQGGRRYALGWRLHRPGGGFDLDLEGWRRERGPDRSEHGLRLALRAPW